MEGYVRVRTDRTGRMGVGGLGVALNLGPDTSATRTPGARDFGPVDMGRVRARFGVLKYSGN